MDSNHHTVDSEQFVERASQSEDFLANVVDRIEGWLDRFAAKRTYDLLLAQERHGVRGGLYEVGLFHGKYFSLLVDAGFRSAAPILGIDTFDYVSHPDFLAGFMAVMGPYRLHRAGQLSDFGAAVLQTRSTDIGAAAVRASLAGNDARFISIDGSHEFDDVLWDLGVARVLLAPGGIIAIDDYLHPICLGVTAAADRFLAGCTDLVPFAYICNKLFLSRPGWADRYRQDVEAAILRDQADPKGRAFKVQSDSGKKGRGNIEARYAGYRILTVAMF